MRIQGYLASIAIIGFASAQSLADSYTDVLTGRVQLSAELVDQMYSQF